jgi:hypothetical protein
LVCACYGRLKSTTTNLQQQKHAESYIVLEIERKMWHAAGDDLDKASAGDVARRLTRMCMCLCMRSPNMALGMTRQWLSQAVLMGGV